MKRSSPLDTNNDRHYATSEEACGCDGFFSHCTNGGHIPKKPNTATTASTTATEASNSIKPKNAHDLLAREMNKMSIEERNQVYDDVHGVRQPVVEDEELIAQKLCEFEAEISSHTRRREVTAETMHNYRRTLCSYASAYIQAEEQSKEFVRDRKRRLVFLRADNFDAKTAAVRFMKYLEEKLNLFGADKLTKRIALEDLDEDDKTHLEKGFVQILPARDRAGRAVIFSNHHDVHMGAKLQPMIRASLYTMSVLAEDEETQKNGVIIIIHCIGKPIQVDLWGRALFWRAGQFTSFMPLRVAGMQVCCDNVAATTILPLLMFSVGSHNRARVRFHKGTQTECRFGLMTFGIPVYALPIGNEGETKLGNHLKWLERQRMLEFIRHSGGNPSSIGIYLPSRYDVLLGRGKPTQEHTGNQRFRHLVETYKEQYSRSKKRGAKTELAESIVHMVKSSAGRFLEQRDTKIGGGWYEVTDLVAREKVSHAFRRRDIKS